MIKYEWNYDGTDENLISFISDSCLKPLSRIGTVYVSNIKQIYQLLLRAARKQWISIFVTENLWEFDWLVWYYIIPSPMFDSIFNDIR